MKPIYLLILLMLFSCKSVTTDAQNTIENDKKMNDKKELQTKKIENKKSVNPNTYYINAEVLSYSDFDNICDKEYKNVATLKVKKVVASGAGIVNTIAVNEEVKMIYSIKKSPDSKLKTGDSVYIEAFEKLCVNANASVYYIYKVEEIKD